MSLTLPAALAASTLSFARAVAALCCAGAFASALATPPADASEEALRLRRVQQLNAMQGATAQTSPEHAAALAASAAETSAGSDPLLRELAVTMARTVHQQMGTRSQQLDVLRQTYGDGLTPERAEILRKNLEQTVLHPQLPAYAARKWAALIRANVPNEQLRREQAATTARLKERGLPRLPADRLEVHVRDMLAQAAAVDADTCKLIFTTSDPAKVVALSVRHITTMPMDQFVRIARLQLDASLAEINDTPPAIVVTPEQAKDALAAYRQAIRKRFSDNVPAAVLARYTVPLRQLPAADVCLLGSQTLEAIFDMPEPQRSWQLLAHVKDLAG